MTRLPSPTALAALPALVLDLETTGLDVANDRIVQVGAVAMSGAEILGEPRIDWLVDPGVPIPVKASGIHGITAADVAGAPPIAERFDALRSALAGRVVVGHNIAFDLAVLRHEAARAGVDWHEPVSLDVSLLVAGLEPTLMDIGLDSIARGLGVVIGGRHTAFGDALATAEVFSRLIGRLRDADVRTLGEARSLAGRRDDLVRRQAEAGWHKSPGAAPAGPAPSPLTRIDSYIYARRLGDVMSAPPIVVGPETTLREAARAMSARRIGALLVGDASAPPAGIVTERDLLRAVADRDVDPDTTPVSDVMSAPVESLAQGEMLYRAAGRMDNVGIRHLCVVDAAGNAVGMVSQRDLVHHRASAAVALGDAVARATGTAALAAAHSRLPGIADQLVAEGLTGPEVARVVSNEVRALTARAAEMAAERLQALGRGSAPAPWCVLVLGSGGRGESLLATDQDNALIHAGSDADDAWFAELGALIADILDEAGVVRCLGGVMAANPQWRGTREGWRARIDDWLRRARPADLLNVDIFFDLVPVAGDANLGHELHAAAVAAASRAPAFTALLAESVGAMVPATGAFGRLRAREGRVDLKLGGLLPLVGLARTLALRIGSTALSTGDRLREASAAGRLAEGDAALLADIQAELLTRVLTQQIADLDAGVRPSSRVALDSMDRAGQRRLAGQLRRLEEMMGVLRAAVAGR